MTTDNLLLSQATPGGWSPNALANAGPADPQGNGTSDPAQFLQALLSQMQRGVEPVIQDGKTVTPDMATAASTGNSESSQSPTAAVLEQLKAFLSDKAVGNPAVPTLPTAAKQVPEAQADGKSLPPTTPDTTDIPTSPDQLLAYLAQWVAPPTQSQPSDAQTPAQPVATATTDKAAGDKARPSDSELAQLLQAAGFQPTPPTPQTSAKFEAQPVEAALARQQAPAMKLTDAQPQTETAEDSTPTQNLAPNIDSAVATAVKSTPRRSTDFDKTLSTLERVSKTDIGLPAETPNTGTLVMPSIPQERVAADAVLPQTLPTVDASLQVPLQAASTSPVPTAATGASATPPPIQTPVGQPGWSEEMGDRVVWMAGQRQGLQSAEIKLNPAHLGPVEVRVNMNQDQASVQFVSNHAAVREALESAVPKLREMLHAQNVNLVDVNVAQHSFDQNPRNDNTATQFGFGRQSSSAHPESLDSGESAESTQATPVAETKLTTKNGLLSLYA